MGVQFQQQFQLPLFAGQILPGVFQFSDHGVEIEDGRLGVAGIAPHRVQNLLQTLGHGAQRLLNLVEHQRLVRRQARRFQAAAQQIVGADQQVLDVVGIGAGHDADAGPHLRFQLQRLPLRRLRRQALFEQLAFRLGVTSLDLEQQALGLIFLLPRRAVADVPGRVRVAARSPSTSG